MDQDFNYRHVATLCHASSNVCPEVFISNEAPEERQVMITDDFGGIVHISREQLALLQKTSV